MKERTWNVKECQDDLGARLQIPPFTSKDIISLFTSPQLCKDGLLEENLLM